MVEKLLSFPTKIRYKIRMFPLTTPFQHYTENSNQCSNTYKGIYVLYIKDTYM